VKQGSLHVSKTAQKPTADELCTIIKCSIAPLLSGSKVSKLTDHSTAQKSKVAKSGNAGLQLRPDCNREECFLLQRAQEFSEQEVRLASIGMEMLAEVLPHFGSRFFDDLLQASIRRIMVQSLGYSNEKLLLEILDSFEGLSAQTYEGNRIAAAIGLDTVSSDEGVLLETIWQEDFIKVLTSGVDTMLTVSPEGRVFNYRTFDTGDTLPFAPYHARHMADYATGKRLAIVLNRHGEILVFKEKRLAFARRRGRWHHFVHEPIIDQIGRIGKPNLRRCVYETCLDVSFARCGGCLAIVKSNKKNQVKDLINADDRLRGGGSAKSQVIMRLIQDQAKNRPFHELHRRFRQAIAAIDGATVLGHDGEILAVGAIVKVPGGSESGARRAAAKALARLGIGIKVSADGGIAGFVQEEGDLAPRLAFEFT